MKASCSMFCDLQHKTQNKKVSTETELIERKEKTTISKTPMPINLPEKIAEEFKLQLLALH